MALHEIKLQFYGFSVLKSRTITNELINLQVFNLQNNFKSREKNFQENVGLHYLF